MPAPPRIVADKPLYAEEIGCTTYLSIDRSALEDSYASDSISGVLSGWSYTSELRRRGAIVQVTVVITPTLDVAINSPIYIFTPANTHKLLQPLITSYMTGFYVDTDGLYKQALLIIGQQEIKVGQFLIENPTANQAIYFSTTYISNMAVV